MYLYRAMSTKELVEGLNNSDNLYIIKGQNTFKYDINKEYIHFFRFAKHALLFQKQFQLETVAQIILPDDIVPVVEYGFYSGITTHYDNSLEKECIPLPEIIIEKGLFENSYITDFYNNTSLFEIIDSNGNRARDFLVKKNIPFKGKVVQHWDMPSVYYEYIKSLLPKFDYDAYEVAVYLKTIDLDVELNKMADYIETNKIFTKKMINS